MKKIEKKIFFAAIVSLFLFISTFFYLRFGLGGMKAEGNQAANEGQEIILSSSEENNSPQLKGDAMGVEITEGEESQEAVIQEKNDNQQEKYKELSNNLKKYCDKKINVVKCKKFLLEAKDLSKSNEKYKKLYKKYHFEKKKNDGDDNNDEKIENSVSENIEKKLIVVVNGSDKLYKVSHRENVSVIELMDLLKNEEQGFSYHSSSGFVDSINGIENSGNMSWMLYTCKDSLCKLSSVGASECKVTSWEKIEWRYLDWTTLDWSSW